MLIILAVLLGACGGPARLTLPRVTTLEKMLPRSNQLVGAWVENSKVMAPICVSRIHPHPSTYASRGFINLREEQSQIFEYIYGMSQNSDRRIASYTSSYIYCNGALISTPSVVASVKILQKPSADRRLAIFRFSLKVMKRGSQVSDVLQGLTEVILHGKYLTIISFETSGRLPSNSTLDRLFKSATDNL